MGIDGLLDHLRIDVEPAGDDHVLLAVDQVEIAVAVHVADVAGEKTVADERLRRFLRPVPVTLGDVRAPDADLTDLTRRQYSGGIVQRDDVHFDAGQHQPDRTRLFRSFRRMARARRAGLGHAPAALELMLVLRSKIRATSTGSGAPPDPQY